MEYEVSKLRQIDFGATGIKEILQNVSFILSTVVYSCPMDREFGWVPYLDSPIVAQQAINTSRLIQAINDYEPRAIVEEIKMKGDPLKGEVKVIVRVKPDESI